ncbi:MAG: molybdate ABC transporter permease subunit [Actinobacteria bacterium]|nr:MAG: molybdate ABC transporter permease subunit [Actinomycetota bacterium]
MTRKTTSKRRGVGSETPVFVFVGAACALAFLLLPLVGLLKRVAWSRLIDSITSGSASQALRLSLYTSIGATIVALVLGVPLAWVLARVDFRGRSIVRALVMLPMVLPPVVGGVALLGAYGKSGGLIGGWLYDVFGLQLTFSRSGVVIAEAFVALPFLVIAVESGLRSVDPRFEESAAAMGASGMRRFWTVTLRLLMPSLVAGVAVAWARALGEFGATITFAGNIEGRTQTTPLAVYLLLESDPEAAYALSFVLLAVCVVVLVTMRDRWMGRRS